jgi:hypothetical protein
MVIYHDDWIEWMGAGWMESGRGGRSNYSRQNIVGSIYTVLISLTQHIVLTIYFGEFHIHDHDRHFQRRRRRTRITSRIASSRDGRRRRSRRGRQTSSRNVIIHHQQIHPFLLGRLARPVPSGWSIRRCCEGPTRGIPWRRIRS